jgi:hypothetical protein
MEYSRMAKGTFTSTGAAKYVNTPFVPDAIEMWNYSSYATPAQHGVPYAYWDVNMGQGGGLAQVFNSTPVLTTGVVTTNGFSTFSAGQALQFGARKSIIGATKANPIVFNVTAHGYSVGDTVMFEGLYQSSTTGMPQICGMPFRISAVTDADHFSVIWDATGSNYTALSGSPSGAYVKKLLYPQLYFPGACFIEAIATSGTTTTVTTTAPHNFLSGQEVAFHIPASWGPVELNALPNTLTPGAPNYFIVVSVTDATNFVINVTSSSAYTAYSANQTVASVPGLSFPVVAAVGAYNTGGVRLDATSPLYPSPYSVITGTTRIPTINGPGLAGAFVNNTSNGFIIGAGVLVSDSSAVLVGANTNVIYWRAWLHDISYSS